MIDARRFADGYYPYFYYSLKHWWNVLTVLACLYVAIKVMTYKSDKASFPHLHRRQQ